MLEELSIRDYAIIERLSVRFEPGLNLLTGETGAGKSILIGALGFLLGDKADTGLIRAGADEVLVSGVADVSGNPEAKAWLVGRGMATEDGGVVLRRSLRRNGRGAAYVQDAPVTRQDLADFASCLVEVHGQRDGMALLRKDRQRIVLDRYAGIEDRVEEYGARYAALSAARRRLESMAGSEAERSRDIELLSYAVDELDAARLSPGEDAELGDEERRLAQHEKLFAAVSLARELVSDADGAVARLRRARPQLEAARAIDGRLAELSRRADAAFYELEDMGESLRAYADQLRFDPDRLEAIEERLALIRKLERKYGGTVEAALAYRDEAVARLAALRGWDEDREGLEREALELERDVHARAEELSAARTAASGRLEAAIVDILTRLGMPNARFAVRLERKPAADGKAVVGPFGLDEPEFYVSANRGEPLRPLADVASGGELSRVMLAIKTVLSRADGIPTLVFDEIDAGIGGEVALGVGEHLAKLGRVKQVLCITHIASIAVRADNHYVVEKAVEGDRTVARAVRLEGDGRVREIARMLSGDSGAPTSLAHAADLLAKYGKPRGT